MFIIYHELYITERKKRFFAKSVFICTAAVYMPVTVGHVVPYKESEINTFVLIRQPHCVSATG